VFDFIFRQSIWFQKLPIHIGNSNKNHDIIFSDVIAI
jgi:hypothetical protein